MHDRSENLSETVAFLSNSGALEDGLRLGGAGVWRWKIDTEQLEWTRNLECVHHLPPGSFDGTLSSFQRDLHPDDADRVWQSIRESIETGAPLRAVYRVAPRPNAAAVWIETSGGSIIDMDGSRYLTGVCLDVTERVHSEQQLQRRLVQQNAVARFGTFALNEPDLAAVLKGAVEVAAEVLNVPLTKILQYADSADHLVLRAGIGWTEGLVGNGIVGIERSSQAGYTLSVNEPVIVTALSSETRFSGPQLLHDHDVESGISVVIRGSHSRPFGVFGIHARDRRTFDQTDAEFLQSLANIVAGAARQAMAANNQILLSRELAHRAGNMLQLANSIANQTFIPNADIDTARDSFIKRLRALARSNYVVSRGGWTSTRFVEMVKEAMEPFGGRVTLEGRDILLPPELCFDMGLVLHEFATNSTKYGSLCKDGSTLTIKWDLRVGPDGSNVFCLDWEDPVSSPDARATGGGFGSKLVSALIERKWNGVVIVNNASDFKAKLEVPIPRSYVSI